MRKHIKESASKGTWLLEPATLTLRWIGDKPAPTPSFAERLLMALLHIRSNGSGPAAIPAIKRCANAIAFCLKTPQVSSSGNPYDTVCLCGDTIEEAWHNFNLSTSTRADIRTITRLRKSDIPPFQKIQQS